MTASDSEAGRSALQIARKLSARDLRTTTIRCAAAAAIAFTATALLAGPELAALVAVAAAATAYRLTRPDPAKVRAAGAYVVGAKGEKATEQLLTELESCGWTILHDRRLPYGANMDHAGIPPGAGGIVVIDSKQWKWDWPTHATIGRLQCGDRDQEKDVASLVTASDAVTRAFPSVPVVSVMVVHGSTVDGGHLHLNRRTRRGRPVTVHVLDDTTLIIGLNQIAAQLPSTGNGGLSGAFATAFPPCVRSTT